MEPDIKDGLFSGYLRHERLRRVARYVTGRSILDIGCDRGYLIDYLPDTLVYHGVDACREMLSDAQRRFGQHSFHHLMLSVESVQALPARQFDTIAMVAVVEHLNEPVDVLRRLAEKLTTSGRIIITSPHRRSHRLLVAMARLGLARNDKHEHEHYIDHAMMCRLSAQSSLRIVVHKTFQFRLNQLWVLEKRND